MCVGSYASRPDNDILAMIDQFRGAINFVHLRNVRKLEGGPNCNGGEKEGLGNL